MDFMTFWLAANVTRSAAGLPEILYRDARDLHARFLERARARELALAAGRRR